MLIAPNRSVERFEVAQMRAIGSSIDYGDPLAYGLVQAYTFGLPTSTSTSKVAQSAASLTLGSQMSRSLRGLDSTNSGTITQFTDIGRITAELSFFAKIYTSVAPSESYPNRHCIFAREKAPDDLSYYCLYRPTGMDFGFQYSAGNYRQITLATTIGLGYNTFGGSISITKDRFTAYVNGASAVQSASGSTLMSDSNPKSLLGDLLSSTLADRLRGTYACIYFWNRELTVKNYDRLRASPFCFFKNSSRYMVGSVAAASFVAAWARRANVLISPGLK